MAAQANDKLYAERSGVSGTLTLGDVRTYSIQDASETSFAPTADISAVTVQNAITEAYHGGDITTVIMNDTTNVGYTPKHKDFILANPGNDTSFTITLPDNTVDGQVITVKFKYGYHFFRTITIACFGTQKIDNVTTFVLKDPEESVTFVSSGGQWLKSKSYTGKLGAINVECGAVTTTGAVILTGTGNSGLLQSGGFLARNGVISSHGTNGSVTNFFSGTSGAIAGPNGSNSCVFLTPNTSPAASSAFAIVAIGTGAASSATSLSGIVMGYNACQGGTINGTYIGTQSAQNSTTRTASTILGGVAGYRWAIHNSNCITGEGALAGIGSGVRISAFGVNAMNAALGADDTSAFGYRALEKNEGTNDGFGSRAGSTQTTGTGNLYVGKYAGFNTIHEGNAFYSVAHSYNTVLGHEGGRNLSSNADNNITIGYRVDPINGTASGQINIGDTIFATGRTVSPLGSTGSPDALVGIGVSAPTAALDIKASTTSYASLRITPGVEPTSPNDGDMWYDSTTHKYKGQENGTIVTFTTI